MADNSVTVVLRDLTTGAGRVGLSVKLRHQDDSYASDIYTASAISGKPGGYEFQDVVYNKYKLWVNGSEDDLFGGANGRWLPEGNEVIRLVSGEWDALSNKIVNVDDPDDPTDALNMQTGDSRYLPTSAADGYVKTTGAQDIEGLKTFKDDLKTDFIYEDTANAGVNIDGVVLKDGGIDAAQLNDDLNAAGHSITGVISDDGDSGSTLMSKTWILAKIADVAVVPYQESPNVIRLIPGGSEKTGQVYTTYANAMQYALAVAGVDHRMCIKIEGMGVAGFNYINMSNAGGDYIDDYIHLKGINQDILLIPPDTVTVGVSALDNTIIENLTIYKDDIGVDLVFENLFFKDVSFNLAVLSVTFTNCKFKNCDLKINDDGDTDATFTTCKGNFIASNQAVGAGVDTNVKPKADF